MNKSSTILVSVPNILERDKLVKRIYANLKKEPSTTLTIIQDQVNRIQIFHNVNGGVRILVRTYLVLVIPVMINLNQLYAVTGNVTFHLDETIKDLIKLTKQLQSLNGYKVVKENAKNESTFEQLVRSLS
jgi:hypothetical protein